MAEQKIDKDNFEDIVALTPVQEGMLFHNLTEPDSKQYMEHLTLSIEGKMDEGIFRKLAQQQFWSDYLAGFQTITVLPTQSVSRNGTKKPVGFMRCHLQSCPFG